MDFLPSTSYRSSCRRPWPKSMDSQEFGFASNLINYMEVAPADELFFKGQLLPLQLDPRLHLVQALSCTEVRGPGEAPTRISYWCKDEEAIEYNAFWNMGHIEGASSCKETKALSTVGDTSDSMVDHCHAHSCSQGLQSELSKFSCCHEKEASMRDNSPHLCDHDPQASPRARSRLPIWREDEEIKGPALSNWSKDEELSFNSCRMVGSVDVDYKTSMGDMTMDLQCSSFRSQNSGFWESGGDKDTGDSGSSSRDSNGSSQDSYFSNNTKLETPSFAPHRPHTKASFNIPWKSLFKKASTKQTSSSSSSLPRKGCSEDLSKYKECSTPSMKEEKKTTLPWKLDSVAYADKIRDNQKKEGKGMKISSSKHVRSKSGFKSNPALCVQVKDDASTYILTATSRSLMGRGKERDDEKEDLKRKPRSAALKDRWQGYTRRLRPLYEMKKGLMGQFRMDECGKRACEVESGNLYAARTPMQRRLCHQVSMFENHKLIIQEQNQVNVHPHKGNSMLAMSSCPPSTRSSPNHSGVLAAIDPKHKSTTTTTTPITALQAAPGTRKTMNTLANISKDASTNKFDISNTHTDKNVKAHSIAFPSSNYSSISTMHELHSALQSAIAHCKESNKRLVIA